MLACSWRPVLVLICAAALVNIPLHSAFLSFPSAAKLQQPVTDGSLTAARGVHVPTLDSLTPNSCLKASVDAEKNMVCRQGMIEISND